MLILKTLRSAPALLLLTLLAAAPLRAEESPWQRKLPFEHATITYEITGAEIGSETLAISDFGQRRAKRHEGTTMVFGIGNTTQSLEITDPDHHYIFDLVAKTGTKAVNPAKYFNEEFSRLTPAEQANVRRNAEALNLSMTQDFQGQTTPKAVQILGYDCDRTTIMGMTVDLIHQTDVPLRTEMNLLGTKTTITATVVDIGKPAADTFTLPPDITPVENGPADALSQQMAKDMVATLKEEDGAEKLRAKWRSGQVGLEGMSPPPAKGKNNKPKP